MCALLIALALTIVGLVVVIIWIGLTPPQQHHSRSVSAWHREDGTRR